MHIHVYELTINVNERLHFELRQLNTSASAKVLPNPSNQRRAPKVTMTVIYTFTSLYFKEWSSLHTLLRPQNGSIVQQHIQWLAGRTPATSTLFDEF